MPGFSLAGLGAGLGQAAQGFDQEQLRQQQLQMLMQAYQQQQQKQQAQRELFGAIAGGGLDNPGSMAPMANLPGGMPQQPSPDMGQSVSLNPAPPVTGGMPQTPPMGGTQPSGMVDSQTGLPVPADAQWKTQSLYYLPSVNQMRRAVPAPGGGGGGTSGMDPYLKRFADLGIAPEYAKAAMAYPFKNESRSPLDVNPTSGALGRMQWLGPRKNALTSQYGPQPSEEQQADFMAQELQGPERKTLDDLKAAQASGAPPSEAYKIWGKDYERPGTAALAKAGVDPGVQAQQTIKTAAQPIDPTLYGRLSLTALAKQIDKANPDADPAVKMMALEMGAKLLAPDQQRQWQMFQMQNRQDIQIAMEQMREQFHTGQSQTAAADKGWQVLTDPTNQTQYRFQPSTGTAFDFEGKPYAPGGAQRLGGAGGQGVKTSKNIEVTSGDGKVIFKGAAHQTPQGWVADKDNKPIDTPEDGNLTISGVGGGGRATAQINSMIGSTSELVGEARNLMELPATATAGIFQGVQGMPADQMGEAVKRTLANKITPEEATDLITSFQGVGRALATIEAQGRATGLVTLTGMSQQLMPQTGDTRGNVLRKLATLRQIMERNTDSLQAMAGVTPEQKELIKKLRDEMAQVIPFTVSEVNKLQHGDVETMRQSAGKFGLAGAGGGATGPKPGDVQDGYMFKGGNPADPNSWEKAPAGAVPTR